VKAEAAAACVVLVTGGASGLGAAGAVELRRRGWQPVLVDQDAAGLAATAQRVQQAGGDPSPPLTVTADVTSLAACEAAVQTAMQRHGRLDAVWANAGMASFGPLAHTDPGAWRRCIDVNVVGVFHTVRAALPAVTAQRGYVALTASVASFAHPPLMSAYAASKASVEAMANAWRIELAAHGVGVGIIHASWVSTPMVDDGAQHPAFARLRDTAPGPLRRMLPAQEAARLIADGFARRADRIWVPGWVRWLHRLRALLHTRAGERALREAAPELERLYLDILATEGAAASSYAPRELQRAMERDRQRF
jgi:NAD(P)-dependent dehydrogenase (short-subunit alcohol dehydrogenase family)